jgi:hypothetical protein
MNLAHVFYYLDLICVVVATDAGEFALSIRCVTMIISHSPTLA